MATEAQRGARPALSTPRHKRGQWWGITRPRSTQRGKVICPGTHSDLMTSSRKQGGLNRALWIPPGFISSSPCPQKALDPVRTQCPSRSPVSTRRPRASPKECGPGPGSGQQDSEGAAQWSAWTGKGDALVSATRPGHSCPGWEPSTRHIHLLLEGLRGTQAASGKGTRTPGPRERKGLGEERSLQGWAEKAQAELDLPTKKKQSTKPRLTLS